MKKQLPLVAALVAVVLWAAAFVGIRAAGRSFSPGPLALGRLAIGSVLLGAVVRSRPTVRPTRRELALLVLAGLLWFGTYQVVLNEAERRVDAGTASMLVLIAPIFIIALAAVFLKERTTPNLLFGGALAFAGVIVIGLATSSGKASIVGVILCLVAALASAIGVVAEKPVLNRISALQVTWTCCAVGALVCLPYAPRLTHELRAAPAGRVALPLLPLIVAEIHPHREEQRPRHRGIRHIPAAGIVPQDAIEPLRRRRIRVAEIHPRGLQRRAPPFRRMWSRDEPDLLIHLVE